MEEGKDSSQRSHDTTWEEALALTQWAPIPGQETSSQQTLAPDLFAELLTEEPLCTRRKLASKFEGDMRN